MSDWVTNLPWRFLGDRQSTDEGEGRTEIPKGFSIKNANPKNPLDLPPMWTMADNPVDSFKYNSYAWQHWANEPEVVEPEPVPASRGYCYWTFRRTPDDGHIHTLGDQLVDLIWQAHVSLFGHPLNRRYVDRIRLKREIEKAKMRLEGFHEPPVRFGFWNDMARIECDKLEAMELPTSAEEEIYLDFMGAAERYSVEITNRRKEISMSACSKESKEGIMRDMSTKH
eukprot:Rmarinus@m.9527